VNKEQMVAYIVEDFRPIELVTDLDAIEQCVEKAIRWFNSVTGDVIIEKFTYGGSGVVTLPDRVDQVVGLLSDRVVTELFTAQTLLLGVTILDYDIMTLALKHNHLGDLRTFLASRGRFKWVKPYLHLAGMFTDVGAFLVSYIPFYDADDETFNYTKEAERWIIEYATGLVKQREGRVLRMGSVIGSPLDGAELVSEGKEEVKAANDGYIAQRPPLLAFRSW